MVVTSDLDIKITGFDQAVDMEEVLNVGKYACKFHASVEFLPYEIVINVSNLATNQQEKIFFNDFFLYSLNVYRKQLIYILSALPPQNFYLENPFFTKQMYYL